MLDLREIAARLESPEARAIQLDHKPRTTAESYAVLRQVFSDRELSELRQLENHLQRSKR